MEWCLSSVHYLFQKACVPTLCGYGVHDFLPPISRLYLHQKDNTVIILLFPCLWMHCHVETEKQCSYQTSSSLTVFFILLSHSQQTECELEVVQYTARPEFV